MAARWITDVSQVAGRPVFPSQRLGKHIVLACSLPLRNSMHSLIISFRLQDETSRVEDELLKSSSVESLLNCFVSAKANSFENLLDPFLKITRLSASLTILLAKAS